jgi:hypothetical protein
MGSAWAAADAISRAAVSVKPIAREPHTFAAVLAPAQRIGELCCVAGRVRAAWRQGVRPLHSGRSERGHDAGDCNFGDDASSSARFDKAPPGITSQFVEAFYLSAPGPHRDATECDVGDAAPSPPPRKFRRHSAYPLYPDLGSRLPTFHDEPKLVGASEVANARRCARGIGGLAAAGSQSSSSDPR